jgi:hypothetical protein
MFALAIFDFDFSSGRFDARLSIVIFRWCYIG